VPERAFSSGHAALVAIFSSKNILIIKL